MAFTLTITPPANGASAVVQPGGSTTMTVAASAPPTAVSVAATPGQVPAAVIAATLATMAANEAAAAASEVAAANSEAAAAASEVAAANSEAAAANSEAAAANSEAAAAASATSASGSATTATTKAGEAAASATSASASATTATTQAGVATTQAGNASASAAAAAASAAAAATAVDNFDDTYLGAKTSDPALDNDGDPLTIGAMYFDSVGGQMRLYTAIGWVDISTAVATTLERFRFTASAGQTVFSGADDSARTLTLTPAFAAVLLNGALLDESDYTVTGSSVTLVSGATAGDELVVLAFGVFQAADTVSKSLGGTFDGPVNHAGTLKRGGVDVAVETGLGLRNKIVDGRFDFWYEGTSQTTMGYGSATMWVSHNAGSTKVHSRQALTPGVDLPAVECPSAKHYSRTVVTSVAGASNNALLYHRIEDVRVLAGKNAVLSFYARADAPKNMTAELNQHFGSGGSANVEGIGTTKLALTTEWARYKVPVAIPSVQGKTIVDGTNCYLRVLLWFDAGSDYAARTDSLGQQSGTFDIACVQLEEGTEMTPFEELPLSLSMARVDRYYETSYPHETVLGAITYNGSHGVRAAAATVTLQCGIRFRAQKRALPAVAIYNPSTGASASVRDASASTDVAVTSPVSGEGYSRNGLLAITLATTATAINAYYLHFVADARL